MAIKEGLNWRLPPGWLDSRRALLILVTTGVTALAIIPLFFLLWNSFKEVGLGHIADWGLTNFTLKNFREAYADPTIFTMLGDSLFFAFGSVLVAFLFGGTIAFLVERVNTPMRNTVYGLMFIPLIMPSMLKAIGWLLLIAPKSGLINVIWYSFGFKEPLFNAFSIPAMFWVEGLSMAPMAFLLLGAALRAMDPSLEEAAYTSGARKSTTLFKVTLPLMTPAIAAVGLLLFIRGLEAFEVPFVLGFGSGIRVFATNIYFTIRESAYPDYGLAFVQSLTLIVMALIGLFFYQKAISRSERFATITGKGYRPRLIDLGRGRWVAGGFILFFISMSVLLPFLILLWNSLLPYTQIPSREALSTVTFMNYETVFGKPMFLLAIKNTLMLGAIVAVGSMLLATVVSWIVIRLKPKGAKVLDTIAFIPYAIPSVAMGFAFMIVFLALPKPFSLVYGTIWILVLAYLSSFLPMATRFTHAGLAQVKAELEEAAAASGASLLTILRRIVIPLILPSLVAGALYIFLLSAKVMSMAAILWTPDSIILPIYILQTFQEGRVAVVSALSVLMVIALTIVTIGSRRLAQRRTMVSEG